ncbi:MAG: hypothetical protein AAFS10_24345, partial [Myxococcota bacterium]
GAVVLLCVASEEAWGWVEVATREEAGWSGDEKQWTVPSSNKAPTIALRSAFDPLGPIRAKPVWLLRRLPHGRFGSWGSAVVSSLSDACGVVGEGTDGYTAGMAMVMFGRSGRRLASVGSVWAHEQLHGMTHHKPTASTTMSCLGELAKRGLGFGSGLEETRLRQATFSTV